MSDGAENERESDAAGAARSHHGAFLPPEGGSHKFRL
jgi:hypothetical protein